MEPEPLYTYVRGKGWVIQPPVQYAIAKMCCGTEVRLEHRVPNIGEAWMRVLPPTEWLNEDGTARLDKFIEALDSYSGYDEILRDRGHRVAIIVEAYKHYPQGFVTVVPV